MDFWIALQNVRQDNLMHLVSRIAAWAGILDVLYLFLHSVKRNWGELGKVFEARGAWMPVGGCIPGDL